MAEKDRLISKQRSDMVAMQQEFDHEMEIQTEQKEKQRVQYMQAIEKQKEEIAQLNNSLLQKSKAGQDSDERTQLLEREVEKLRAQVKDADERMKQQTSEMTE